MILARYILGKFDMKILQTCPVHLSDVATLPWEIQKAIFNSIIHTYFWLFTLSQNKNLTWKSYRLVQFTCQM